MQSTNSSILNFHIKLRIANLPVQRLFALHPHLEVKVVEALGMLWKDYHGKPFEDRKCSNLLDTCDSLALLVPSECLPIIDCLKTITRVAEATFGYRLSSNYEEVIEQQQQQQQRIVPISIIYDDQSSYFTTSCPPFDILDWQQFK